MVSPWKPLGVGALALTLVGCGAASTASQPGHSTSIRPLVATMSGTVGTIDPNKIYSGDEWDAGYLLYRGLYMLNVSAKLVPAAASGMPTVSDGGLIYTIHLKRGLKWSNGDPVTARDFAASIDRELNPKTGSPDGYLWPMLQGARAYESGHAPKISGVSVLNALTIQYHLTRPSSAFPDILATPAGFPIVPKAEAALDSQPVTDCPWVLKSWEVGTKMTFAPNPHYTMGPMPKYPGLEIDMGVSPSTGILRVQSGQADWAFDGIPSSQYASLTSNPKWSKDIVKFPDIGIYLLALNERAAPFHQLAVRQAVEMAINKKHLVRLLQNRGIVANGVLPKTLPGFGADIPNMYPYNPAKARKLLAHAGFPHGFTTTLGLAAEGSDGNIIGTEVQNDLKAVGITVHLKPLPQETTAVAKIPMLTYTWFMDYPDAADFINGFTGCSAAVVGGSNPAFLCDPGLDRMAASAEAMPLGPARKRAYKAVDQRVMKDAAYVPLYLPIVTMFHSSRIHPHLRHPLFGPAIIAAFYSR